MLGDRTLGSFLDDAARRPDALAIVDGDERITYGRFAQQVQAFERGLHAIGVARGDVVTVVLPNWWEANVVIAAVVRAGCVVNPVVPIYREREIGFIVEQARSRLIVVPHRFRAFDYVEMLQGLLPRLTDPPRVVVARSQGPLPAGFSDLGAVLDATGAGTSEAATPDPAGPATGIRPDEVALLLYTSGTTADPKGVLHTHQTLEYENRSMIELFSLGADDVVFMPSPLTHITGLLYGIVMPIMLGVPVVLLDVWDPELAHRLVEAERCRFTLAATPFLQGLTDAYDTAGTTSALRVFACGGADVPPDLVRRARRILDATVVRVYGSSEFPTFSCGAIDDDVHVAAETDGRPIGPVSYRLEHEDAGVGELLVRGPELFVGYLDPGLNGAAFTDDGYFRTGDLASVDGEAVVIRGRSKDIIIRGGENISAKEVEDLLYGHPDIRDVAVVAMPDARLGELACAFVVAEPGTLVDLVSVTGYLEEQHIARQKHPEHLELLDELPRTATGKVQKFLLRQRLADHPV